MKHKADIEKAINSLKEDKNNAVAFIYEDAIDSEIVVTLKDIFATKDAPTQASSKLLEGFNPGYDATIVKKLKEANASIVAKVHMDELALGGTGEFSAFGLIKNPIDESRIVGGSSSGSAATFNEHINVAIGSDTGDSVRLPASYNGHVGFKPSYGAVSRYGMFAFASSLDTVGWFTHNVSDSIEVANILYGIDELDMTTVEVQKPINEEVKPKSVAILDVDYFNNNFEAFNKVVKSLEDDGIAINIIKISKEILEAIPTVYDVISYSEASSNDSNLNGVAFGNRKSGSSWDEIMDATRSQGFGPMVQRRFTLGSYFLQKENQSEILLKAQKVRRLIKSEFEKIFSSSDILIYPTATIAPLISEGKEDTWFSSFLAFSNLIGNPSISIPLTKVDGMPMGLSIDSKIYSDKQLLSNALYLEKKLGGNNV